MDPYWKSQPGTYEVNLEWKLELNISTDHSHSWARISHDEEYDDNEEETSETKTEVFAFENEKTCFCKPIKG